jgi:hypothetical protein
VGGAGVGGGARGQEPHRRGQPWHITENSGDGECGGPMTWGQHGRQASTHLASMAAEAWAVSSPNGWGGQKSTFSMLNHQ